MGKSLRIGGPYFEKLKDSKSFVKYHQEMGWAAAYCPDLPDPDLQLAFKEACRDADIIFAEVWAHRINITDMNEESLITPRFSPNWARILTTPP